MRNTAKRKNILVLLWSTGQSGRDFLYGFSRYARHKANWNVRLFHARAAFSSEIEAATRQGAFDGIVTDENTLNENPFIADIPRTAVVIFGTERNAKSASNIRYVQNDDRDIGRFGAEHLYSMGRFRSFGFAMEPPCNQWMRDRARGFVDYLVPRGQPVEIFQGQGTSLTDWLRSLPKPTAIMAAWDDLAINVIQTAKDCDFAVPKLVSVLGVDNDELLCEFTSPTLSSICPQHDENGYESAKLLDKLFAGRPPSKRVVVCTGKVVKVRESTAPLSPSAHVILSATEYIRHNAGTNIRVDDVVRHLGISRRLADLRFREILGETIQNTITHYRLCEVEKRLLTTSLPIAKVAANCGFRSVPHLETIFKRKNGDTLQHWRKCHDSGMNVQGMERGSAEVADDLSSCTPDGQDARSPVKSRTSPVDRLHESYGG